MFILYYKPTCPFCQRVLQMADSLGIELELKDISEDSSLAEELATRSGKRTTPYLVDETNNIEMAESQDIIDYLRASKKAVVSDEKAAKPRVHISENACVACEG